MNSINILILGPIMAGKTAYINRLTLGEFNVTYNHTNGEVIYEDTTIGNITVKFYESAQLSNIDANVDFIFVMFDKSSKTSYDRIGQYIALAKSLNKPFVILGNKVDKGINAVSRYIIQDLITKEEAQYYDISAKSCFNFERPIIDAIHHKFGNHVQIFDLEKSADLNSR